jgi:carboxylate-amine ligase
MKHTKETNMDEAILEDQQALAVSGKGPAFLPPFTRSQLGTIGIELELMVLDRLTYDLLPAAPDILRLLDMQDKKWVATPEITTSMLEVATSVLDGYGAAAAEIEEIRASVQRAAFQVGAAVSGGGAHPFQKWNEQRIYPKERYRESAKKYGYLAKMFTVFGMHVHIGMPTPTRRSGSAPGSPSARPCSLPCRPTRRAGKARIRDSAARAAMWSGRSR